MTGHEHIPPASSRIPIATGTDGQAYIPATAVVALLRGIAYAWRQNVRDIDDMEELAEAVDQEADALDCRAILRTK